MRPAQIRGLAIGLVVSFALLWVAIPATAIRPENLVLLATVAYVCWQVRRRLGVGARPAPPAPPPVASLDDSAGAEQDVRLARLDAAVSRAAESGEQFAHATRPYLRQLAAQRLHDRTGIDVTANPQGARRQMGEELWQMFSADPDEVGPPPAPERLQSLVAALERL